jgi:hypothetical protein
LFLCLIAVPLSPGKNQFAVKIHNNKELNFRITGVLDFVHVVHVCPKMFRKLDLFPSSSEGRETPTPLGLLGRAKQIQLGLSSAKLV